ncbi:hypothetical protein DXH95_14165 [Sphingorhabdus pulchriflava]|uniref:Uncharacterized protein n=1 Tax=Sphingorhabdus pulchriflava TaxID=2292257 RepID=A0A371B1G8_9SPHN|nr:hypothetical protein DXH95_14165 [Sphingorhabdus pulchriflava]
MISEPLNLSFTSWRSSPLSWPILVSKEMRSPASTESFLRSRRVERSVLINKAYADSDMVIVLTVLIFLRLCNGC